MAAVRGVYTPGAGPSVEMPLPKLTQDPPAVARPEVARPEAAKPEVVPKAPVPGVPPAPLGPKNESLEAPKETVRTPNPARAIESVPLARPRAVPPEPANPITPVGNLATPAPEAIRVPAPASPGVKLEGARIPPLVPRIPGGDTTLPPLNIVIPGDAPSTSTSRSSPLSSRKAVEVIPVAGDAPASPRTLRNVGFFNNSERDVTLTVQGETITLPKHTFVTANVPRSFTWKLDAEAERTTEIPPGAPGVEVVIRR